MGLNTAVFILNDCFDELQRDPKRAVSTILQQMSGRRQLYDPQGLSVMSCHHSSSTALIAVGGNCFTVLHHCSDQAHSSKAAQVELLHSWAKALGFDLRRRRVTHAE